MLKDAVGMDLKSGDFITFAQGANHPFQIVDTGEVVQPGPGGQPVRILKFVGQVIMPISPQNPVAPVYKLLFKPEQPPSIVQ
jgi:hypothetical protein